MAKIAKLKDGYLFNFDNGWLYKGVDKVVEITGREADLLRRLCEKPNYCHSMREISDMVAFMDYDAGKAVRVKEDVDFSAATIRYWKNALLKKHEIFKDKKLIEAVKGEGYIYYGQPITEAEIEKKEEQTNSLPHELTDVGYVRTTRDSLRKK